MRVGEEGSNRSRATCNPSSVVKQDVIAKQWYCWLGENDLQYVREMKREYVAGKIGHQEGGA